MRNKIMIKRHADEAVLARLGQYIVLVRIQIGHDRMLSAPPTVVSAGIGPFSRAAMEAAIQALERSQPFDMLPLSNYDTWHDMEINFDPRSKRDAESNNAQTTASGGKSGGGPSDTRTAPSGTP
jgi:hypothetical protein